jgi:hypothetical protein
MASIIECSNPMCCSSHIIFMALDQGGSSSDAAIMGYSK